MVADFLRRFNEEVAARCWPDGYVGAKTYRRVASLSEESYLCVRLIPRHCERDASMWVVATYSVAADNWQPGAITSAHMPVLTLAAALLHDAEMTFDAISDPVAAHASWYEDVMCVLGALVQRGY
jgi:hypothetical protein